MKTLAIPIEARTLTPFCYHSLAVQSGTATLPELISDRAVAFGLAAAMGMTAARVALPKKDYRAHLAAMPFRTSVFMTDHPKLLPPLTRRLNMDAECGFQKRLNDIARKGNLKDFFHTQEVPPGQIFKGVIFGLDNYNPFEESKTNELVIRVGLHRSGMVALKRREDTFGVRLNASTGALFDRELAVERYCLHYIQLSPLMDAEDAGKEVAQWT